MQEIIKIKQGNTFRLSLVFRDPETKTAKIMTDKEVSVIAKTKYGIEMDGITVRAIDATIGTYEAYAPPTATQNWPEGSLDITIDVSQGLDLTSSQTFLILIERR